MVTDTISIREMRIVAHWKPALAAVPERSEREAGIAMAPLALIVFVAQTFCLYLIAADLAGPHRHT